MKFLKTFFKKGQKIFKNPLDKGEEMRYNNGARCWQGGAEAFHFGLRRADRSLKIEQH